MMEMIKKYWGKIVLTSAVVLAASLAGGYGWVMPVVMLAAHLLCLLSAFGDKRIHTQSRKALDILFWIMPVGAVLLAVISRISENGADARSGFTDHGLRTGTSVSCYGKLYAEVSSERCDRDSCEVDAGK